MSGPSRAPTMANAEFNHKAANLWVSRIIPLVLIGIVGYVTWVVIVLLCGRHRPFDSGYDPAD